METSLKKRIMRRVWGIYLVKKAVSPIALQTYILSFFVWQILLYVSMRHVFENAPNITNIGDFSRFYFSSFLRTELIVQMLAVGTITLVVWLTRNVTRGMRDAMQFKNRTLSVQPS